MVLLILILAVVLVILAVAQGKEVTSVDNKTKISDSSVLGIIYTLVLAAILAVFVGVTLNTFYPAPEYPDYESLEVNYNEKGQPATEQDRLNEKANMEKSEEISKKHQKAYQAWQVNASIIIFLAASFLVAVGLFMSGRMAILPNGILLGGFFTLLYGVGLGLSSQSRYAVFFVTTASLVVIVAAGYLKFVRPEKASGSSA